MCSKEDAFFTAILAGGVFVLTTSVALKSWIPIILCSGILCLVCAWKFCHESDKENGK